MDNPLCPKRIKLHTERTSLSARVDDIENVIAEFEFDHPVERLVIDGLLRKRDALSARIVAIDRALARSPKRMRFVKLSTRTVGETNVIPLRPNDQGGHEK